MSRQVCHGCKGSKKWADGSVCANCDGKGYIENQPPPPTEGEFNEPACHCGTALVVMRADDRHGGPFVGCPRCDNPKDPRCKVPTCGRLESEHDPRALLRCLSLINGLTDPFA